MSVGIPCPAAELTPVMSKNQYGVSMRHDPHVHNLISTACAWYDVRLQRGFDMLVYDRAEALMDRMSKDLKAMRDTPASEVFRKPSFAQVIKELFDINVPPFLQEAEGGGGKKGGNRFQQRRTRRKKESA